MKNKVALIIGQNSFYQAEFLLDNFYKVYGIKLRSLLFNTDRIDHLHQI